MLTHSAEVWRYKRKQDISPEALRASWRHEKQFVQQIWQFTTNLEIYIYIYRERERFDRYVNNEISEPCNYIFKKVSKRTWSESVNCIYNNESKKTWFEKNISIIYSAKIKMIATVHISAAQTQTRGFTSIINSYTIYFPYNHFEAVRWSLLWKRFTIKLVFAFWY